MIPLSRTWLPDCLRQRSDHLHGLAYVKECDFDTQPSVHVCVYVYNSDVTVGVAVTFEMVCIVMSVSSYELM